MYLQYRDSNGDTVYKDGTRLLKQTRSGWWYRHNGQYWVVLKESEIPQLPQPKPSRMRESIGFWSVMVAAGACAIWGWENVLWKVAVALVGVQVFLYAGGYFLLMIWMDVTGRNRHSDPPTAVKYYSTRDQSN